MNDYNPESFWETRLTKRFNVKGVGYISFSDQYNRWLYKAKIRALKKLLPPTINLADLSVCDLGCGTGFFTDWFQSNGVKSLTGVDITDVSVQNLKAKYPQFEFHKHSIAEPTLPETIHSNFDLVTVFDVIYHVIDDALFKQVIQNVNQLVRKDGYFIITDMFLSENFQTADHVRFRSMERYHKLFDSLDFEILRIQPMYYLLNRPIFGTSKNKCLNSIGVHMDNGLGPLYYFLDSCLMSGKKSNLKMLLARKKE